MEERATLEEVPKDLGVKKEQLWYSGHGLYTRLCRA